MVYILLADGFEEIEALAPLDVLRRAEIPVKTAGVGEQYVCGAHGVQVKADMLIDEISDFEIDAVILPGGMPGALNLQRSEKVNTIIDFCAENGKLIAAICAAPMIIGEKGLLKGRRAVCFPGYEDNLIGAELCDESVVKDGNIITATGAGASLEFGAAIVDYLTKGSYETSLGNKILARMQVK